MGIRIRSFAWVIVSALVVAGCGGTDAAKRAVEAFRSRSAQRSYAEIYRTARAELRQGTTEEQFERFMTAIDRTLRAWQSAEQPGWNVMRATAGHLVRLTYQSQFERGGANEQFLWRIEHGQPVLIGYHVNSPLLAAQ
jgi:hypothetical protein